MRTQTEKWFSLAMFTSYVSNCETGWQCSQIHYLGNIRKREQKCRITGNLITMLRVKRDFFSPEQSRVLPTVLSDLIFSLRVNDTVRPTVECLKRFKHCSYVFMTSEERWTADENILFFKPGFHLF